MAAAAGVESETTRIFNPNIVLNYIHCTSMQKTIEAYLYGKHSNLKKVMDTNIEDSIQKDIQTEH